MNVMATVWCWARRAWPHRVFCLFRIGIVGPFAPLVCVCVRQTTQHVVVLPRNNMNGNFSRIYYLSAINSIVRLLG